MGWKRFLQTGLDENFIAFSEEKKLIFVILTLFIYLFISSIAGKKRRKIRNVKP